MRDRWSADEGKKRRQDESAESSQRRGSHQAWRRMAGARSVAPCAAAIWSQLRRCWGSDRLPTMLRLTPTLRLLCRSPWWATGRFASWSPTEPRGRAMRPRTKCCSTATRRRVIRSSSRQRLARCASTTPMDRCASRNGQVHPSGRGVGMVCRRAAVSAVRYLPTNLDTRGRRGGIHAACLPHGIRALHDRVAPA